MRESETVCPGRPHTHTTHTHTVGTPIPHSALSHQLISATKSEMPQSCQQQKEAKIKYDLIAGMCLYGHKAMSTVQSTSKKIETEKVTKEHKQQHSTQTANVFLRIWNHLSYSRVTTLVQKTEERVRFRARDDSLGKGQRKVAG